MMQPVFDVTFYKLHIENNYSVRLEREFVDMRYVYYFLMD